MISTLTSLLMWIGLTSFWLVGFYPPVADPLNRLVNSSKESTVLASADEITFCGSKEKMDKNLAENLSLDRVRKGVSTGFSEDLQNNTTTILIEVVPDFMKFNVDTFSVKAGHNIILELDNLDGMQHNLLIVKPNTLEKVGAAADEMLRDPKASEKQYVPDIPEVLFATKMLDPDEVFTLKFTAPKSPGYYPFVCTFPGHWRIMNGIMKVENP